MTSVTVFPDKYLRSYPERPDKPLRETDRGQVVELGAALEGDYATDAHFAAYVTPNTRRLNSDIFDAGGAVELTTIVFDLDAPDHVVTPEWRRETRERVVRLADMHPDPYFYETRGGARIVYQQPETTILHSADDGIAWRQAYAVVVAHLEHRFGLLADMACSDWQRLYRLPRTVRDAGGPPENHPRWGNPDKIGIFYVEATHADVDAAKQQLPKAFDEKRVLDFAPSGADGFGLLYYALRARGDVGRQRGRAFIVRCPYESEHTSGSTADGSTLLYPPAAGEQVGAICCLHAHCAGRSVRDWLRCFSDQELQAARVAAGIEKVA